jgi:hypothetical protein
VSGRIRTIKPELLDDAVTAGLSDMAFRIFISTIVLADDYGRLRAEPGWLLAQIYWARGLRVEDFSEALKELEPLVLFFEVKGQRYAEIRNWSKHQKVSHPGKPRIPAPPESLPRSSGESPETLVPDLRPRPPTPTGGEPERVVDSGTPLALEASATYEASVSEVTKSPYALRRHDRSDLFEAINGHAPRGRPASETLGWIRSAVQEWIGQDTGRAQFTGGWSPKHFHGWLNGGRKPPPELRRTGTDGGASQRARKDLSEYKP